MTRRGQACCTRTRVERTVWEQEAAGLDTQAAKGFPVCVPEAAVEHGNVDGMVVLHLGRRPGSPVSILGDAITKQSSLRKEARAGEALCRGRTSTRAMSRALTK